MTKSAVRILSYVHGVVPTRRLQLSSGCLRMVGRRGLHWPDNGRSEHARWRRRRRRRRQRESARRGPRKREKQKRRIETGRFAARMTREPVTAPWWWWGLDGGRGVRLARNVIVVIIIIIMTMVERINII